MSLLRPWPPVTLKSWTRTRHVRICIILFLFSGHFIKWVSHIWLLIYLCEVLDITVWHQEALMKQTALCALQCVIGALYLLLGHPGVPCAMFSWHQMHVTTIVSVSSVFFPGPWVALSFGGLASYWQHYYIWMSLTSCWIHTWNTFLTYFTGMISRAWFYSANNQWRASMSTGLKEAYTFALPLLEGFHGWNVLPFLRWNNRGLFQPKKRNGDPTQSARV